MNSYTNSALIFLSVLFFSGCSSMSPDDLDLERPDKNPIEEVCKEIKLSVPTIHENKIYTDDVTFEFEILDGNGDYTVSVPESESLTRAIATLDGNKVKVEIINNPGCEIVIRDKKEKEARVYLQSRHPSLIIYSGTYGLMVGSVTKLGNIDFGVGGPYEITKVKGDASEIFEENKILKVKALKLGKTDYIFKDRRGTAAYISTSSSLSFTIEETNKSLEFNAVNYMSASVKLNWGTEWEIESLTNNILEKADVSQAHQVGGGLTEWYYLMLETKEDGSGTDRVILKNNTGDKAIVEIHIP